MHLTSYTDYALRVLIFLGVHTNRIVRREEIANAFGISANHVGKVVNNLAQAGFIEAKRGRGGGLTLAMDPADIIVGEVVDAFEPNFDIVECFDPEKNRCPIAPVCGLGPILKEAQAAFHDVLRSYTLADVLEVRGKRRYKQLLRPK